MFQIFKIRRFKNQIDRQHLMHTLSSSCSPFWGYPPHSRVPRQWQCP